MLDVPIPSIGDPHYDDTSLALLFSQLKMKTLQTAKGTSEISGWTEFNFVLQIARVFCRMGRTFILLPRLGANDRSASFGLFRVSHPRVGPREVVVFRSTRRCRFNQYSEYDTSPESDISSQFRGSFRDGREHEKGKQDPDRHGYAD